MKQLLNMMINLMEKFFDDPNTITEEEMHEAIRKATIDLSIVPMMCGSSFKNKGVQTALDAIVRYLPGPMDIEAVKGINPDTGEEIITSSQMLKNHLLHLAFKIMTDPFVGRLAFFRCLFWSSGCRFLCVECAQRQRKSVSAVSCRCMPTNKTRLILLKQVILVLQLVLRISKQVIHFVMKIIRSLLENMFIPEPVISVAVEPKTQADVDKMGMAIAKLVEEDPTLRVKTDEETGQTILSGMGELHLEIIVDRMRREFKVEINQGAPQVAYKEAFTTTIEHREALKKQTGGRGKFADIVFEIGPADEELLKEGNQVSISSL